VHELGLRTRFGCILWVPRWYQTQAKQVLIVGRPQVGKTLFLINYAAYLGQQQLKLVRHEADQTVETVVLSPVQARTRLVGEGAPHKTLALQHVAMNFPKAKGSVQIELCDTPGLVDTIPSDEQLRRGMAQAIRRIRQSHMVLHIVDATRLRQPSNVSDEVASIDEEIARFGLSRGGYVVLVNKIDLPGAQDAPRRARALFPGHLIIGVSALTSRGFKEVTRVVRRYL